MFWADVTAQKIIKEKKYRPYHVDDMFTPSGYAHVGSLRGPLVHDVLFRALDDADAKPSFTYIMNDFDPIDGLPPELMEISAPYLGVPLRKAPSPFPKKGHASFADYFADDFKRVLTELGLHANVLSSWDLYHEGKFNAVIHTALDHAEEIQDIYQKISGSKKKEKGWLPLQVICPKCGKLGTTRVHAWDGTEVSFTCEPAMVKWATGCGYEGKISPFDGNAKLPWKVDWPAHWSVLNITIEGAGKDHSSAGGSRDIARELCNHVFTIQEPYNLPYEFFLIGGKKMSSSKGLGLKARDLTTILPPAVGRFLFIRTDYRQAVEFDPVESMAIPDLFDEYDRCWQAYISGSDLDLARVFELSQINELPPKTETFLPRFRDIANYIRLRNVDLQKKFEETKGERFTLAEHELLNHRILYASKWLGEYAPTEYRLQMSKSLPDKVTDLSSEQKKYLKAVSELLEKQIEPKDLQMELYTSARSMNIEPKSAFSAIYTAVMGQEHGPRAAWFLLQYSQEEIKQRLLQAAESNHSDSNKQAIISALSRPDYFEIQSAIQEKFPSVSVGVALIKGAKIQKTHPELEKEKKRVVESLHGMTTEQLGEYPEIKSYRKLYKEMSVDWHSRRPSPEALLRRIALGKGLYTINTCVDAYNLVVMKHRISVGAFDANQVKFPTVLRFAGEGDEILLLGDEKPTQYTEKELAYYDQEGGYNIDFNYRDAKRTCVTEKTTDILINVDGIYDISPENVQEVLDEAVRTIVQYCGGTVEFSGVVTPGRNRSLTGSETVRDQTGYLANTPKQADRVGRPAPAKNNTMKREEAIELLHAHMQNANLRRHCYAVETVMRALARHFGEDEDVWGIAGLLHDADYEETKEITQEHSHRVVSWLKEKHADERIINAILAHAWKFVEVNPEPSNEMEWSLYCCDELTGFIVAVALIKGKSLANVTVESVLKKFPVTGFAAGVHRPQIKLCEEKLGIKLEDFVGIALKAMQDIHKDLGL